MDSVDQLNYLTEALRSSFEDAEYLMRSFNLSLHARLKLFCLACMNDKEKIAQIIINEGFEQSSSSGQRARGEVIRYLKRLDDPKRYLSGYITSTSIKDDVAVMGRAGRVYVSNIFPKMRKVTLLAEGFTNVELYLLDRSFLLEQNVNVNVRVGGGCPLLHVALEMGHAAVVELLLSRGADPNMTDGHGANSLHAAAKSKSEDVVELLVNFGGDIHCVNDEGRSPMHELAAMGFEKGVKFLIAKGCEVDLADKNGDTPLHEASINGQFDIVKLLLRRGARVNAMNKVGRTPLLCAAIFPSPEDFSSETREKVENIIEVLVKNGADVNHADSEGSTALHHLAAYGYERGVYLLLKNDASVNSVDLKGSTPLHKAAGTWTPSGRPGVIELLLRHGAEVDARDSDGQTPLVRATVCRDYFSLGSYETPQKDVVERLLNFGADTEACESSALLRAMLSRESTNRSNYEQPDVVRKLLEHGIETSTLLNPVPSAIRPARYIPQALKTALEYGLVRAIPLMLTLVKDYEPQTLSRHHFHQDEEVNVVLPDDFENDLYLIETDEQNREAVKNLVGEHVAKLQVAGLISIPPPSDCPEESIALKSLTENLPPDFYTACKREVEGMKVAIPGVELTFHELLFMTTDQLARLARNKDIIEALSGVEEAFPMYECMLIGRMRRGQVRCLWAERASYICQSLFNWQLRHLKPLQVVPPEITERVVANFSDAQLKWLVIDHERDPILPMTMARGRRKSLE